uniref:Uncharacterized protein n=1 Tax=Denticeps clupeoides TaxID=299321 RepID=A0AAY4D6N2_9TELE
MALRRTVSTEDEEEFLRDPDQLHDHLPQPFRAIEKAVDVVVDRAWEVILQREKIRSADQTRSHVPSHTPLREIKISERVNCLACSDDGRYIFLGHTHGLSVISTSCFTPACTWEEGGAEITSIHSTRLRDTTHLLSTVDNMGVPRLFALHADRIYLMTVISETDDFKQRNICVKFQVSRGGYVGAATFTCRGSAWLQVYRFPTELWMTELHILTQQRPENLISEEQQLSPIVMMMKIKPPRVCLGNPHH